MDGFLKEKKQKFTDVSTVESQRNDLTLEEFPEGPYGMDLKTEALGKSEPWRDDQDTARRFQYEDRELHKDLPRNYPQEDPQIEDEQEEH